MLAPLEGGASLTACQRADSGASDDALAQLCALDKQTKTGQYSGRRMGFMKSQAFFLVLIAGLSGCFCPDEPNPCEGREEGWTCIDGELYGVCLAGACMEPVRADDAGLEHVDGQCFALAVRVYPASYAWCEQAFGGARPVPFACMSRPPVEACEPIAGYADRFCCCDPAADAACAFYK